MAGWLAAAPRNGYYAGRAISSHILYMGTICACYALHLLNPLCQILDIISEVRGFKKHLQTEDVGQKLRRVLSKHQP